MSVCLFVTFVVSQNSELKQIDLAFEWRLPSNYFTLSYKGVGSPKTRVLSILQDFAVFSVFPSHRRHRQLYCEFIMLGVLLLMLVLFVSSLFAGKIEHSLLQSYHIMRE